MDRLQENTGTPVLGTFPRVAMLGTADCGSQATSEYGRIRNHTAHYDQTCPDATLEDEFWANLQLPII